jgi:hypothetical protein
MAVRRRATTHFTFGDLVASLDTSRPNLTAFRASDAADWALRWIEQWCNLRPTEPGLSVANVRKLQALICRGRRWNPPFDAVIDDLPLHHIPELAGGPSWIDGRDRQAVQRAVEDVNRWVDMGILLGTTTIDFLEIFPPWYTPGSVLDLCDRARLFEATRKIDITGRSCKVIAGTEPSQCPAANPRIPDALLSLVERAFTHAPLAPYFPDGMTIHWVGDTGAVRGACRCPAHLDAPSAAPCDRERWRRSTPVQVQEDWIGPLGVEQWGTVLGFGRATSSKRLKEWLERGLAKRNNRSSWEVAARALNTRQVKIATDSVRKNAHAHRLAQT